MVAAFGVLRNVLSHYETVHAQQALVLLAGKAGVVERFAEEGVAIADVNGDGMGEIVVCNQGDNDISITTLGSVESIGDNANRAIRAHGLRD